MTTTTFKTSNISRKMIDEGMRQGRIERTKAFFALFDSIIKGRSTKSRLSDG